MSAFNVVRFRVKAGTEAAFIEGHRQQGPAFRKVAKGLVSVNLVKTGERAFCLVGEWRNFQNIVNARPHMIGMLDGFRDMLEELDGGLGLTDAVSGESVLLLKAAQAKKARKVAKRGKKAKAKVKARTRKTKASRKK